MKFHQHIPIDPDWPEYGFTFDGKRIKLADVEATFPPNSNERAGCYFLSPADPRCKVWPWKESGYYTDDEGNVLSGAGPFRE